MNNLNTIRLRGAMAAGLTLALAAGSAHAAITDGLVGYWSMDSISGSTVYDTAPAGSVADNAALAAPTSTPTVAAGKLGNALYFDGNDRATIASSTDLNINANQVTLAAWVNLSQLPNDVTGSGGIGSIYDSSEDSYILYEDKANHELRFKITTTTGDAARPGINNAALSTGEWLLVVGTFDGSGAAGVATIYLNGVQMDQHVGNDGSGGNGLTGNVKTGQVAYLGSQGAGQFFQGGIDDVAVWNRVLSTEEIAYLYNGGAGNPAVATAVPEPAGAGLLMLGLGTLAATRRR